MSPEEIAARENICKWGRVLYQRGLAPGSSGNLSQRCGDALIVTPTNACLGDLDPARLAKLDLGGHMLDGDAPTKEVPLHLAFYEGRPTARAIVHLHSTYAVALASLADIPANNALPPVTPYAVMRLGPIPVLPYARPGSDAIAAPVRAAAARHTAVLLANHGPVVSGTSFEAAVFASEELEETAKLVLLTRGMTLRHLDEDQIAELDATYRLR